MSNLEFSFSFIYLGEIAAKLLVVSWSEYWSSAANKFDFWTTWILLFSAIAEKLFASSISTYANMLRLLRLLRMLKAAKSFEAVHFMVDTVTKLVFASQDILVLLFVVLFFFTTLSVMVFGGEFHYGDGTELKIEEDGETFVGDISKTEYGKKFMYALNFNDWPSAFSAWFVFLLSEYKPELPEIVWQVSETEGSKIPKHSWVLFLLFYLVAGSIIFELVMAFTIEKFVELKKEWQRRKLEGEHENHALKEVGEEYAKKGENLHYRVVGPAASGVEEEHGEHGEHDSDSGEEEMGHGHGHGHEVLPGHEEHGGHH
jgi:hypothetical protein